MNEFKINDKVICIDAENRELVEGQIYTIFDIHTVAYGKYIVLKESPKKRYWFHRFKKLTTIPFPDELFEMEL